MKGNLKMQGRSERWKLNRNLAFVGRQKEKLEDERDSIEKNIQEAVQDLWDGKGGI